MANVIASGQAAASGRGQRASGGLCRFQRGIRVLALVPRGRRMVCCSWPQKDPGRHVDHGRAGGRHGPVGRGRLLCGDQIGPRGQTGLWRLKKSDRGPRFRQPSPARRSALFRLSPKRIGRTSSDYKAPDAEAVDLGRRNSRQANEGFQHSSRMAPRTRSTQPLVCGRPAWMNFSAPARDRDPCGRTGGERNPGPLSVMAFSSRQPREDRVPGHPPGQPGRPFG